MHEKLRVKYRILLGGIQPPIGLAVKSAVKANSITYIFSIVWEIIMRRSKPKLQLKLCYSISQIIIFLHSKHLQQCCRNSSLSLASRRSCSLVWFQRHYYLKNANPKLLPKKLFRFDLRLLSSTCQYQRPKC